MAWPIADKTIPLDQYRALGEPIPDGKYFQQLCGLAKELGILLVAGMLEAEGTNRFNTAVVIGPQGELLGRYHKQHLEHEAVRNTAGTESSVVGTPLGTIGVMICADRRLPEVVKGFCERGAEFLLCPSVGMYGPRSNDPILQARSKENARFIVFVHPAEFLVTGPDGTVLAQTVLGDRLVISPDQVETEADSKRVFYFDVPRQSERSPASLPTPAGKRVFEPMNHHGATLDAGPLRRLLDVLPRRPAAGGRGLRGPGVFPQRQQPV